MAFRSKRKKITSAISGVPVTTNSLITYERCSGVYIGNAQDMDFSFDGIAWITFQGLVAGTVVPLQVVAARVTSGQGSPAAGDIVFLYSRGK